MNALKGKLFTYRAGDILVACDNEMFLPDGIMGHSAIAVSEAQMVESTLADPNMRLAPIVHFERKHRLRAVYRPKNALWGERAAQYARWYLAQSEMYRRVGQDRPPFSLSLFRRLDDPWSSVYCSKLVWLCYHYGAGYTFDNDHFLFTPEDLDTLLRKDRNFLRKYRHRKFKFLVDT